MSDRGRTITHMQIPRFHTQIWYNPIYCIIGFDISFKKQYTFKILSSFWTNSFNICHLIVDELCIINLSELNSVEIINFGMFYLPFYDGTMAFTQHLHYRHFLRRIHHLPMCSHHKGTVRHSLRFLLLLLKALTRFRTIVEWPETPLRSCDITLGPLQDRYAVLPV